jgi:uncharacterized membrane protein
MVAVAVAVVVAAGNQRESVQGFGCLTTTCDRKSGRKKLIFTMFVVDKVTAPSYFSVKLYRSVSLTSGVEAQQKGAFAAATSGVR